MLVVSMLFLIRVVSVLCDSGKMLVSPYAYVQNEDAYPMPGALAVLESKAGGAVRYL